MTDDREKPPYIDSIEDFENYQIIRAKGNLDHEMIPIIEENVFNLNEGDVSNPIEVDTGIYIFVLEESMEKK